MSSLSVLAAALVLGIRHSLEPDHVATVSVIVSEEKKLIRAIFLGVMWGIGHGLVITLASLPFIALGVALPESVGNVADILVGLVMIWLGASTLYRIARSGLHFHWHAHGDVVHAHFHLHPAAGSHLHEHPHAGADRRQALKSFLIGCLHGLAGSGAAMVLLAASSPTWSAGLLYLLLFSLGGLAGMVFTSCVVAGVTLAAYKVSLEKLAIGLSGLASLVLGAVLVWSSAAG